MPPTPPGFLATSWPHPPHPPHAHYVLHRRTHAPPTRILAHSNWLPGIPKRFSTKVTQKGTSKKCLLPKDWWLGMTSRFYKRHMRLLKNGKNFLANKVFASFAPAGAKAGGSFTIVKLRFLDKFQGSTFSEVSPGFMTVLQLGHKFDGGLCISNIHLLPSSQLSLSQRQAQLSSIAQTLPPVQSALSLIELQQFYPW